MAFRVGTVFCLAVLAICFGEPTYKFTIQTNLEKLFYMESELISLLDVYVREEHFAHDGKDVHDFAKFKQLTDKVKNIHREVKNVSSYIAHPINVLHLTRRFVYEWPKALKAIEQSEPCQKWNIPEVKLRLSNIKINMPRKINLQTVSQSIARIEYTENLKMDDLSNGVISGKKPHEPMTIGDLLDIAWGAYEGGQYLFTTKAAETIIKECQSSSKKEECDNLKIYRMAAASYFKINQLKKALEITDIILKKNPDDVDAKRSKKFYTGRLNSKRVFKEDFGFDTPNLKYYDTCRGNRKMSVAQASRLHCRMLPTSLWMLFEKGEYHNNDPPVIEIHHTFSNSYIQMIKNAGENGFKKQAYSELYNTPKFRHQPPPTHVYNVFSTRFDKLIGPLLKPYQIGTVEVRQAGMEGMYFPPKNKKKIETLGAHVGSFFTFINDDYTGGEFVFPKHKIKIKPVSGNTIFFFATKTTLNICPVSYGSQWYAIQSLFETRQRRCRPHEEDLQKF